MVVSDRFHFSIYLHLFLVPFTSLLPPLIHLIRIVLVSSVQYTRPLLTVRLKPSRHLAVMLSLAHFTAIGLLWPLAIPVMVKLAGSAILAASLVLYIRYYVFLTSPGSVRGLKLGLDAADAMTCMLETQRGDVITCMPLGSSFVAPYLAVLELKPVGARRLWQRFGTRSVVILPDGIDAEEFRQLRVLLRWKWKNAQEAH
jgi:toxin CptA